MAAKKKGQPPNRSKTAKKRSYAKKTPQSRAYSKPSKVKESSTAGATVARAALQLAQKSSTKDRLQGALDTGETVTGNKTPPKPKKKAKRRPKGHA